MPTPPAGPGFIGIGAQKAATTWLFKWLSAHPEIGFAPLSKRPGPTIADGKPAATWPKEVHFLTGPNQDRGWDWYLDLFRTEGRSERLLGDITPRYLTASQEEISALRRRCPDVRLLLNLRDPVERDWSAIRMLARRRELLDQPAALVTLAGDPGILKKGDLRRTVSAWLEIFPREQFFISALPDIEARPQQVIRAIAAFLGADPAFYSRPEIAARLQEPVHRGPDAEMPPELEALLRDRHRDTYQVLDAIRPDSAL
ncbi:MAG: sulfotransferase [Rhodobacteraceae bacterium]|nr:sulfotransferase [Paracoccaceae bacterium]